MEGCTHHHSGGTWGHLWHELLASRYSQRQLANAAVPVLNPLRQGATDAVLSIRGGAAAASIISIAATAAAA